MRVRFAIVLTLALAVASASGTVFAHHSFSGEFDNTASVTLHGVVTSVELVNPHSFIHIDVDRGGAREQWALEGPASAAVARRGLADVIKAGDALDVSGYLTHADANPVNREAAIGTSMHKMQGAVITLPGRAPFLWSNYRQGKCGLDR
jgi:hypothetical protein